MKTATTATLVASTTIALLIAAPAAAHAHVGLTPSSTAAGGSSVLTFAFSHGCSGSPTTALTFTIPDTVASVTPTVEAGWSISRSDDTITYTAAEAVPDGQRATVELAVRLPEGEAGEVIAFPVVQSCEIGEHAWVDVAGEGEPEPESPAPTVVLSGADADAASGDHHATAPAETPGEASAPQSADSVDLVGRWLGGAGIVVGTIGVALAVNARRKGARA